MFSRLFAWQRMKDSNPHKRSQSPVCYHYTNPLNARAIIQHSAQLSIPNLKKITYLTHAVSPVDIELK